MKEATIKQIFSYLNINNSRLYKPSNYTGQKNFICRIKYNYWFLTIRYNMYSFIKENPELQTREEFKFNSAEQLKVAISKDSDIKKVLAFVISQLNYMDFLKTNDIKQEGTNLKEVFASINNHYIANTYLYQDLIETKTITIDRDSVIFAPLQSSRMTIRPELRQSNYMTREQIDEFFRDRVRDSVDQLVSQTQRMVTINSSETLNTIREQLGLLSERIEAMNAERDRLNE